MARGRPGRKKVVSVFKKQGVYSIHYDGDGHRKYERIGVGTWQAKTLLHKHNREEWERPKL
jgi:hypothetical protein